MSVPDVLIMPADMVMMIRAEIHSEKSICVYFHTESALVRPQITCGTHALSLALAANLRPGDELLAPAGKPYDTLEEVIGIRPSNGSLAEYGISYSQVDLLADGTFDYENIKKAINDKTKMVAIQRSKGYQTRPSFSVKQIGELITFVKGSNRILSVWLITVMANSLKQLSQVMSEQI